MSKIAEIRFLGRRSRFSPTGALTALQTKTSLWAAGITPGLIYHYFKSKQGLLLETIEKHSWLKVTRLDLVAGNRPLRGAQVTKGARVTLLRPLRVFSIVLLILLAFQFEFGIAVNLSPSLQEVPPLPGSVAALWTALAKVGAGALVHALLGTALSVAGLVGLALAIMSRGGMVAVTGILSFLFLALAEANGILFTLSGFKNDGYSHGMATGFLLAFSLYFLQVCMLSVKLRR